MNAPSADDEARIPRATYRLQLHRGFDFTAATRIVPYLARLGISHVYCSPISKARPGSMHGYDVVAHDDINPELGGRPGYARFSAEVRAHGMGQLLDLVPNHMGVLGADNAWWMDVLENGPASEFAEHFDINWHPLDPALEGKVLLPVLGDHYGTTLLSGELVLAFEPSEGSFAVRYHAHRFPLDPGTYPTVLMKAAEACTSDAGRAALTDLTDAFAALPARAVADAAQVAQRRRDQSRHKAALAALVAADTNVAQALAAAIDRFNADGPRDALHDLLSAQAHRLAHWRVAADEINYRRFFDVNELAALRVEHEPVFEATHRLALDLAASGIVDGLRIDHPDGLHDPAEYFERLQRAYARRASIVMREDDTSARPHRPLYVLAEKIAASHEAVPERWYIHGGTGYRFATLMNGVLVDSSSRARFDRIWHRFTGREANFDELAFKAKLEIARTALAGELTGLATQALRIARMDRRTRDHTFNSLRNAIALTAACMPVYRTYVVDAASAQDRRFIEWAIAHARHRDPIADPSVFDFLSVCLLGEVLDNAAPGAQQAVLRFAMRFQQFSSPVAAKGVEDTAFYREMRLVSLNEVGGDPAQFGTTVRAFHGASAERAVRWPHTMLATSTHDTKRSEDTRNRIDVLSEVPAAWQLALTHWSRLNRAHHGASTGDGSTGLPSPEDEYLLYQTLLGTLPANGLDDETLEPYRQRIHAYMVKASREAKLHTNWAYPNKAYDAALAGFVDTLLARVRPNPFLTDLQSRARQLAWFGALNSLTMVLVKYTSPGVPDLYQGNELMDLSLVDPDNRRPVDFALRERVLAEFEARGADRDEHVGEGMGEGVAASSHASSDASSNAGINASASLSPRTDAAYLAELMRDPHDGRAKLWVIWRLLQLRAQRPALFANAAYKGLDVRGEQARHVIAFTRSQHAERMVVIAGRLFARLGTAPEVMPTGRPVWSDTRVKVSRWPDGTRLRNVLTGEELTVVDSEICLADAFATFPGAALVEVQ